MCNNNQAHFPSSHRLDACNDLHGPSELFFLFKLLILPGLLTQYFSWEMLFTFGASAWACFFFFLKLFLMCRTSSAVPFGLLCNEINTTKTHFLLISLKSFQGKRANSIAHRRRWRVWMRRIVVQQFWGLVWNWSLADCTQIDALLNLCCFSDPCAAPNTNQTKKNTHGACRKWNGEDRKRVKCLTDRCF